MDKCSEEILPGEILPSLLACNLQFMEMLGGVAKLAGIDKYMTETAVQEGDLSQVH